MAKFHQVLTFLAIAGVAVTAQTTALVDLDYEVHAGVLNLTALRSTGNYYVFQNIPFAEQPVGALRFEKTTLPQGNSSTVNNGSTAAICFQASPSWNFGGSASLAKVYDESIPDQTEACLVLDVYAPAGVLENVPTAADTPVLVWIHGGGFTSGSKVSYGDPAGLISRSGVNGSDGVIFVSLNYRLGAFGWLAGGGVTPNLGLYDQRLALEWVQKYIDRFGGSKDRVTVMGESAGASSILHHITSYGGAEPLPFQQAIIQSPAYQFWLNASLSYGLTLEAATNATATNITDVEALKMLDADTMESVNEAAVEASAYGEYGFGPIVDGTYVPTHPQVLLLEGQFDQSLKLLISHTSNESIIATDPALNSTAYIVAWLHVNLPRASNATVQYIVDVLYPDVLDGTYPWTTEYARGWHLTTDLDYGVCTTRYLARALGNTTHNELFSVGAAYHGEDNDYIFFNEDAGLPVIASVAVALQTYIGAFVRTGDPNAAGLVEFPEYGDNGTVLEFSDSGVAVAEDDLSSFRCNWWQQAMAQGLV